MKSNSSKIDVVIAALLVISIIIGISVACSSCADDPTTFETTITTFTESTFTMTTESTTTKPTTYDKFYEDYQFSVDHHAEWISVECFDVATLPIEVRNGEIVDDYFVCYDGYYLGSVLLKYRADSDRDEFYPPEDLDFPDAETYLGNLDYDSAAWYIHDDVYPVPWADEGFSRDHILFRINGLPVKRISFYIVYI